MLCILFSRHIVLAGSLQLAYVSAGSSNTNYRVCRCIQSAPDATLRVEYQSLVAAVISNSDNVIGTKCLKRRNHARFFGALFATWRFGAGFLLRIVDAVSFYGSAVK